MTDSILRSDFRSSYTVTIPFSTVVPASGAVLLLDGETDGFAIDATTNPATVAVIDTVTPANNLSNVSLDASNLVNSSTSPKLCRFPDSPYLRWSPHNLFLNSGSPATQSVTLQSGAQYTYGITGTGSLAGVAGASGTATAGAPVTFRATTTTGTFNVTGSPTTMWINRGDSQTAYLATTGSIKMGIPHEYDAVTGQYGILVEPVAINLAGRTEDMDVAYGETNITLIPNSAVGPNGQTVADEMFDSAGSSQKTMALTSFPFTSGVQYTCSIYAKGNTRDWYYVQFPPTAFGAATRGWFNVSTGALGSTNSSPTYHRIEDVGGGWYRCSLTASATSTVADNFRVGISNADNVITYTGDGLSSIYIWGLQIEAGPIATSLIHVYTNSTNSSVTRAADVIETNSASWQSSNTGNTIYLDCSTETTDLVSRQLVDVQDADLGDDNSMQIYTTAGSVTNAFVTTGIDTSFGASAQLVKDTRWQGSFAVADNNAAWTAQGQSLVTDASCTNPDNMAIVYFGADSASVSQLSGHIYRFVIVPRRVTDGDLPTWRYNF